MLFFDNLIFSLQKFGGISTYWYELTKRILSSDFDFVFFERQDVLKINHLRQNLIIPENKIIKSNRRFILLDRFRNIKINNGNKIIFHSSYNRVVKNTNVYNVVTIHDFIHEKFYSGLRKILHSYQKKKAIINASAIIVVSKNTKKDLLTIYPKINHEKVHVVYNGVSDDFYPITDIQKSNDILFVGSREKYKNFHFVVLSLSKHNIFSLTIVGSDLTRHEIQILNKHIPGRWKLFTAIDNNSLNILYNTSFALLYPSSYEGFGIPILEAMKSGCPFIALNASSIPEVAGNAGVLITELTQNQFDNAINNIMKNRNFIVNEGFFQVKKFSWDKCYNQTIEIYKKLLDK